MHNGAMIRGYWPEFLVAVVMSIILLASYFLRGNPAVAVRPPQATRLSEQRFLLELENPQGKLRVDVQGQVSGLSQGRLTVTELNDLRLAVGRLLPAPSQGRWKVRFYDATGAHEVAFEPARSTPEIDHVVKNLRILGYLKG